MKIALASDLHLEFAPITLTNTENADVLILSGDILVASYLKLAVPAQADVDNNMLPPTTRVMLHMREFFKNCVKEFPHVVYVAGNHEHYNGNVSYTHDVLKSALSYPNLHILDKESIDINGYTFVGSTLWTDCNHGDPITTYTVESSINDYRKIRIGDGYSRLRTSATINMHVKCKTYVEQVCQSTPGKVVVVGHHAPTRHSIHPMYVNDYHINGAYASDLSELILNNPNIVLWTAGHTHHSYRYYVGDTLVACNPRGYAGHESVANDFKLKYIDLANMPSIESVDSDRFWSNLT